MRSSRSKLVAAVAVVVAVAVAVAVVVTHPDDDALAALCPPCPGDGAALSPYP
jgi:hypothetical protein